MGSKDPRPGSGTSRSSSTSCQGISPLGKLRAWREVLFPHRDSFHRSSWEGSCGKTMTGEPGPMWPQVSQVKEPQALEPPSTCSTSPVHGGKATHPVPNTAPI